MFVVVVFMLVLCFPVETGSIDCKCMIRPISFWDQGSFVQKHLFRSPRDHEREREREI